MNIEKTVKDTLERKSGLREFLCCVIGFPFTFAGMVARLIYKCIESGWELADIMIDPLGAEIRKTAAEKYAEELKEASTRYAQKLDIAIERWEKELGEKKEL